MKLRDAAPAAHQWGNLLKSIPTPKFDLFFEISMNSASKWYFLVSHDHDSDKMILGNLVSTFIVCYHQF